MKNLIKPQIIPCLYEIEKKLEKAGLNHRDLVILIQDRTRPKLTRVQIENALQALKKIEAQFKVK